MASPGVLKTTMRDEREFQPQNLKSGRSIKKNNVSAEREEGIIQAQRFNRCSCERLPPVPRRSDPPPVPYPPNQDNYVDYNTKHVAEMANYHEPKSQIVDSEDGHTMDLKKSGLVPHFSTKPNFGRVPAYLKNGQQLPETPKTMPNTTDSPATRSRSTKDRQIAALSANKEIEMLQKRWIELENRLRLISFSRPDKRDAIEDELRSIEVSLRMAVNG